MSHVPEDDEVKRLLAMTDSDDSKGKPIIKKPDKDKDKDKEVETGTEEWDNFEE